MKTSSNNNNVLFIGTLICVKWTWLIMDNFIVFLCCITATPVSDHLKLEFELYINDVRMVTVVLCF